MSHRSAISTPKKSDFRNNHDVESVHKPNTLRLSRDDKKATTNVANVLQRDEIESVPAPNTKLFRIESSNSLDGSTAHLPH